MILGARHIGYRPDIVGEIGRPLGLHARTLGGMAVVAATGLALEDLFSAGRQIGIHFVAGKAQHIAGHSVELLVIEGFAEGRHETHATLGDGQLDLFHGTTPQPAVIHKIGEKTHHAGTTGAMAGGTVVTEQTARDGASEGQHFLVGKDLVVTGGSHLLHVLTGTHRMLAFLHVAQQQGTGVPVCFDLLTRVIGEGDGVHHTLGVGGGHGPGRVQYPVDQGEHHGGIEGPDPPVGQRIVEFLQIAIPGMAGGLDRALLLCVLFL